MLDAGCRTDRPLGAARSSKSAKPLVYFSGDPGPISGRARPQQRQAHFRRHRSRSERRCAESGAARLLSRRRRPIPPHTRTAPRPPRADRKRRRARARARRRCGLAQASGSPSAERFALIGRLAEQAIVEMGPPLDRDVLDRSGSMRTQRHGPDWLSTELLGMGKDLSRAKKFRDAVLEFMGGRATGAGSHPACPRLPERARVERPTASSGTRCGSRRARSLPPTAFGRMPSSCARRFRRSSSAPRRSSPEHTGGLIQALGARRERQGLHPGGGQPRPGAARRTRLRPRLRLLVARAGRRALAAVLREQRRRTSFRVTWTALRHRAGQRAHPRSSPRSKSHGERHYARRSNHLPAVRRRWHNMRSRTLQERPA